MGFGRLIQVRNGMHAGGSSAAYPDVACQMKHYREDLVGEALQTLYDKHGFKREDLWLQTK